MNAQIMLDLITIARNDWIANSLGNKISAANVVDTYRVREKKEAAPTQPGRRITWEVLESNPGLGRAMKTPLVHFFEHYSNPDNTQHLEIQSSVQDIVNDPDAKEVIKYVQRQFDYVEKLIGDMSREENEVRLSDVRSEIERVYQAIFGYLDTIHGLVLKETGNDLNRENTPKPGEGKRRRTDENLPIYEVGMGEKM